MKEPKSLDENIIFQIGETSKLVHEKVTAIFRKRGFNVTVEQFGVLVLLWYKEGVKQQDIADGLKRNKTTITRKSI
jgi:DNA-binding MarR family transcriptional regulator